MLLWETWDQAAEEICSDGMGVGCAGSQGCTLGPWAACCEGGQCQRWEPVALGVWLPEWHLSGLAGKFPEQAVAARGLLSDQLMAAGQHHCLHGFPENFWFKGPLQNSKDCGGESCIRATDTAHEGRAGPQCYVVFQGMFRGAALGGFCYAKIHTGLHSRNAAVLSYLK